MGNSTVEQLGRIEAELGVIRRQLDRIEGVTTDTNNTAKDTNERTRSLVDDAVWGGLVQDAILCGICLSAVTLAVGYRFITTHAARGLQQFCDSMPLIDCNILDDVSSTDSKIKAFLDAIAWAEGADYDVIVGGSRFTDYSDHPRQLKYISTFGVHSDAAGRYQFISPTWSTYAKKLGLDDFSPASQDKAAIAILEEYGVPEMLEDGRVEDAICVVGPVWASFPCNSYGQNPKSSRRIANYYRERVRHHDRESNKTAFPIQGQTASTATITSHFGPRIFDGKEEFHSGIDYGASLGTPLVATESGVVTKIWDASDGNGCGNGLMWDTGMGTEVKYCHMDKQIKAVGDRLTAGEEVGTLGNTGRSTGPHIHVEVYEDGELINPLEYLRNLN